MIKNINKIWVEAIPLKQFFDDEYGEEIQAVVDEYKNTNSSLNDLKNGQPKSIDFTSMLHAITLESVKSSAITNLFEKVRSELLLESRHIIGLNDTDYLPKIIPADFWFKAEINSYLTKATLGDLKYEELRMVQENCILSFEEDDKNNFASHQEHLSNNNVPDLASQKQVGRPKSRRKVEELLNEIVSNHDEIFFQLNNRTDQAREIRARLLGAKYRDQDNYPEFSTDSIKRWIGAKLKTI